MSLRALEFLISPKIAPVVLRASWNNLEQLNQQREVRNKVVSDDVMEIFEQSLENQSSDQTLPKKPMPNVVLLKSFLAHDTES